MVFLALRFSWSQGRILKIEIIALITEEHEHQTETAMHIVTTSRSEVDVRKSRYPKYFLHKLLT